MQLIIHLARFDKSEYDTMIKIFNFYINEQSKKGIDIRYETALKEKIIFNSVKVEMPVDTPFDEDVR